MKTKIGVIGCGNISRFHFEGLEKAGAEIVHIAEINKNAAMPYIKKYNALFTEDYNELIKNPDVTAVLVLASSSVHKDICLKALANGKDVICEKTMADNASEALEILNASKKSDRLFFVTFMKRFFPALKKAKELVPELGTIISAKVKSYQAWGNFYKEGHGWDTAAVVRNYGGAITKCAGSHIIDMFVYLLGKPDSVCADINFYNNSDFDIRTTALFGYNDMKTVLFEAVAHPLKKIGYERNSWDEGIEIVGTEGRLQLFTVMWDYPERNAPLLKFYDNKTETETEFRFDIVNPFTAQSKYIVDCLEKRVQGTPGSEEGYIVDYIIEKIFESDKKKTVVSLTWQI